MLKKHDWVWLRRQHSGYDGSLGQIIAPSEASDPLKTFTIFVVMFDDGWTAHCYDHELTRYESAIPNVLGEGYFD